MAALKPSRREIRIFRSVLRKAEGMGLVVPEVRLKVVARLKGAHAHAIGNDITVERSSFSTEVVCHEVAHVLAGQLVMDEAAAHNRFWSLIYGLLYQACIQK